jgi:signal peptidase I
LKIEDTGRDAGTMPAGSGSASNGASPHGRGDGPPEGPRQVEGTEPYARSRPVAELPQVKRSRLLRWTYWAVWFGIVPVALSWLLLWALSPVGAVEPGGLIGWLQAGVRSQPVPIGIVLFTLFEAAFWGVRLQLPFARHAHPPQRADLPARLRGNFERARVLLDEADSILARNENAVIRELTAKERESLRADLDHLHETMVRPHFDEVAFGEALGKADAEVDLRLGRWRKSEVREYVEAILMAIAVALALRTFVVEAFKIPSGSMIPTLMVGDHIFVNKFIYGPAIPFTTARVWTNMPPRRGDVMVFAFPEHPEQDFIKRVIAVPGDKLEARNGHPIVNGWEVPSCRLGTWSYSDYDSPIARHEGDLYVEYLGDESFLTFYDHPSGLFPEYQGPFFVKPGEVWVMGDNRNNSHDSRMWFGGQGGGVPFENIKGRALFVWLSINEGSFDASRLGAPVMGRPRLPPSAHALEPQLAECLKNRPAATLPPKR